MSGERGNDSLQLEIDEMKDDCRQIADYADALMDVMAFALDGVQVNVIVELTLKEIIKLAERNR